MIGYKTFKSEQALLDWQEAETPKIFQVLPLVHNMYGVISALRPSSDDPYPQEFDIFAKAGCFVLYEVAAHNTEAHE